MKVTYDPNRDDLRILLSDAPIERSSTQASGLTVDYDTNGDVVGLELTLASQRMPDPRTVEFIEQLPEYQSISNDRFTGESNGGASSSAA